MSIHFFVGGYYVHAIAKRMPNADNELSMPDKAVISYCSNIFLLLRKVFALQKTKDIYLITISCPVFSTKIN